MAKQDKGALCRCGCGERKTSRKKKFVAGHAASNRVMNIAREVENDEHSFRRAAARFRYERLHGKPCETAAPVCRN